MIILVFMESFVKFICLIRDSYYVKVIMMEAGSIINIPWSIGYYSDRYLLERLYNFYIKKVFKFGVEKKLKGE